MPIFRSVALKKKKKMNEEWRAKTPAVLTAQDTIIK